MKQHQTLVLPCFASGNPKPYVTWKKAGMDQPYREGELRVSAKGLLKSIFWVQSIKIVHAIVTQKYFARNILIVTVVDFKFSGA